MPDSTAPLDPRRAWARHISRIGADHGAFNRIDTRHFALLVEEEAETLVLSFDRADRLWDQGSDGLPLGFEAVPAHEVTFLSLLSVGRTWFRSDAVEALLAGLAAEGFFASFRTVLILAYGPDCTHAAARAAALIPGARVVLGRPVAAISASRAPFERRFRADRRIDPDMPPPAGPEALLQAEQTVILYDPRDPGDAAHAALFHAPGTLRVGLPMAREAILRAVATPEVVVPLTRQLMQAPVDAQTVRALLRPALRSDPAYRARLSNRT